MKARITIIFVFFLLFSLVYSSPSQFVLPLALPQGSLIEGQTPTTNTIASIFLQSACSITTELLNNGTCSGFSDILPNTEIVLQSKYDFFSAPKCVSNTIEFFFEGNTHVIGYPVSGNSIASGIAASVYGISQVAFMSGSSILGDKNIYPYFSRTGPPSFEQALAIKGAVLKYSTMADSPVGWTDVAVISTINEFSTDFAESFLSIAAPEISIISYQQILENDLDIDVQLNEIKKSGARVIMGFIFGEWESFIKKAAEFGLVGDDFVWFVPASVTLVPFSEPSEESRGILGVVDHFPSSSFYSDCFLNAWRSADPLKYAFTGPGTTPITLTYRAFDTVVISAMAADIIDKMGLLEDNIVPAQLWADTIRNITFDGLSGIVKFRENGDRIGTHDIINYTPEAGWNPVGIWSAETGYEVTEDVIWHDNTTNIPDLDIRDPFKYWSCHNKKEGYDPTGKRVTLDTPDGSDIDDIDIDYHCDHFIDCKNLSDESYDCAENFTVLFIVFGVIIGILVFVAILLVLFVCIFGIILKYRRLRVASPVFLLLLLFSMIVGYISIFTMFGKPHPVSCAFQPWLLGLSSISMIVALSVKNFRIWRIFKFPMKKVSISNFELIILWAIVMLPAIFIIVLWTIISTPTAKMQESNGDDHYICTTGGFTGEPGGLVFFFILVAYGAFVLLVGAIISYLVRNVPSQFNESRLMTISIYNIGFLSVVIIPVYLVVIEFDPFVAWILRALAILYAFTATMILQFLPKLFGIFITDKGRNVRKFKSGAKLSTSTLSNTERASSELTSD